MPHLRHWYSYGSMALSHDLSYSSSATIEGSHSSTFFLDLPLNNNAKGAVPNIKDKHFWKCMYILLCAVFPELKALWYCNSNMPCMDKPYYLSHRTMVSIEKSQDDLILGHNIHCICNGLWTAPDTMHQCLMTPASLVPPGLCK